MDVLKNHPWITALLILAVVGYLIVRRLAGEPLNARDLCVPPLILTALGGYELIRATGLEPVDYVWAGAGIVIGVACGAWRGSTIKVFLKDGVLWQRYTGRTFVVWLLSLAGSGGFVLTAMLSGMHEEARPTALAIGAGLLGEAAIVGLRALSTGQRFAPDTRERDAIVHQHMKDTLRGEGRGQDLEVGTRDGLGRVADRMGLQKRS